MKEVDQYRQEILDILLQAKDDAGNPKLSESAARRLAKEFTDQELIDGMDYNTPEEVAEMLLDSGLEK